ncbi:hypothetical protein WR25_20800 isoform B [Diploscapter pachys]|uniref:DJ-1/PfpI domain-containing protein n=1 Tax=Diploscapter pachys TaxID=2018661 RepID=A0A2A2JDQ2_9BILA|nr:hypothetical protein WR25_20800 isoform B [Diploscapter pachys]
MMSLLCLFLACLSLFSTTKATMAEKTALLIATDGSEEMEVVITADVLVRGGVKVTIAGLNGTQPFKCARGTKIVPDAAFEDAKTGSYDVVILPGGQPGSNTLAAHEGVGFLLREQHEKGKLVAAICAAPIALKSHKIPADLVTSHPSVQKQLEEAGRF